VAVSHERGTPALQKRLVILKEVGEPLSGRAIASVKNSRPLEAIRGLYLNVGFCPRVQFCTGDIPFAVDESVGNMTYFLRNPQRKDLREHRRL